MDQTLGEYKEFLKSVAAKPNDSNSDSIKKCYKDALARLKVLSQFEESLEVMI